MGFLAGFADMLKIFATLFSPATWFLFISFMVFISMISRANKDPNSPLNWEDMLLDDNKRMSVFKLGQIVGIIVGTWTVIDIVDAKHDISAELIGLYYAFLVGAYSANHYFTSKAKSVPQDSTGAQKPPEDAT